MNKSTNWNFAAILLFFAAVVGFAQTPAPYTARLQPFLLGLSRPILIRSSPDNTKRLFIVQQAGIIKVVQPGSTTPTDFINLSSKVVQPTSTGDERGLLGMTFHPQYATNGKFYVNYTRVGDGTTVVAEYKVNPSNPNQGDIGTERILFTVPQPFSNHNGGMVEFGNDGYLYIGMGDGGSANDPGNRAQTPSILLGKLLRIDVNIPVGSPDAYLIPPTNPFTGAGTARCPTGGALTGPTCQELWTLGMRNPWRYSFDRSSGALWVADVGQGSVEEVDVITSGGGNYGWRVFEGNSCTGIDPTLCTTIPSPYTFPLFQYNHTGGRCSITGGYVYRGTLGSLPQGAYTYADYCTGETFMWNNSAQVPLPDTPRTIVSFGEDANGEIYICYGNGQIDRMTRAKASADFDGDLRTDVSVFRPTTGVWYITNSSNSSVRIQGFGVNNDIPTAEDFDGDNMSDIGVFRPSDGVWYFVRSSNSTVGIVPFGTNGDIPAAADYDGDAKADLVVFRPSTGTWYALPTVSNTPYQLQFGLNGDVPVAGDYDGDGRYDIAVWRSSNGVWFRINSSDGAVSSYQFGIDGDVPTQADFDGDGRTDTAVFRPSTGVWYILRSSNNSFVITQWGVNGDVPVVGDYDGDGLDDIAVFRPSNGTWYRVSSSNGANVFTQFGSTGDLAVPRYDVP